MDGHCRWMIGPRILYVLHQTTPRSLTYGSVLKPWIAKVLWYLTIERLLCPLRCSISSLLPMSDLLCSLLREVVLSCTDHAAPGRWLPLVGRALSIYVAQSAHSS